MCKLANTQGDILLNWKVWGEMLEYRLFSCQVELVLRQETLMWFEFKCIGCAACKNRVLTIYIRGV